MISLYMIQLKRSTSDLFYVVQLNGAPSDLFM